MTDERLQPMPTTVREAKKMTTRTILNETDKDIRAKSSQIERVSSTLLEDLPSDFHRDAKKMTSTQRRELPPKMLSLKLTVAVSR